MAVQAAIGKYFGHSKKYVAAILTVVGSKKKGQCKTALDTSVHINNDEQHQIL
jgi:hypothetical protein